MKFTAKAYIVLGFLVLIGWILATYTCQQNMTPFLLITLGLGVLTIPPFVWMVKNPQKSKDIPLVMPKAYAYCFNVGASSTILFVTLLFFRPNGCADS
jgi:hypothetical protein